MRKKGSGHYRALLLTLCLYKDLSQSTRVKISQIIGSLEENMRENKAKEILEKIQDCNTEKEVIQKLKLNTL